MRQVVVDRVGQDEVAVRQALHERRGTQAVRAVVGEVRLAGHVQTGQVRLEVVVNPQATHGVVDGRVNAHRHLVGVVARDALVHVEEVAVLRGDGGLAHTGDGLGEVEVDAAGDAVNLRADATALVAHVLGLTRCDIAGHEVTEGRVDALQVVVAILFGDLTRVLLAVLGALGNPDATVVTQRLRHEGQLRLLVAVLGDARGVDLREAGVAEVGALAVRAPDGGRVAAHRVGGQEEHVAVAAGRQDHRVGDEGLELAGGHVAGDDAARLALVDDEFDHLVTRVLGDGPGRDLTLQRLVGADQELLAGLATGVEGTRHLHATEGAVVEEAAVLAGEGDALRDALVDDVGADLGEAVDVVLAGAVVAALDRVVEETVDGVVVVAVVLRGVDTTLRGNGVRAAGGVLVEEAVDVVSHFAERGGGSAAREAGADDDDAQLTAVGGVDERGGELALLPALRDRDVVGGLRVGDLLAFTVEAVDECIGHDCVPFLSGSSR